MKESVILEPRLEALDEDIQKKYLQLVHDADYLAGATKKTVTLSAILFVLIVASLFDLTVFVEKKEPHWKNSAA